MLLDLHEENVAVRRRASGAVTCAAASIDMKTVENGSHVAKGAKPSAQDAKRYVYVYERNPKTGSTSWIRMIRRQAQLGHKEEFEVIPCRNDKILNTLAVSRYQVRNKSKNAILTCHLRRVAFARRPDVRIISSFFVQKDMVLSKYLQGRSLNLSLLAGDDISIRNTPDYKEFVEGFKIDWQLKLDLFPLRLAILALTGNCFVFFTNIL